MTFQRLASIMSETDTIDVVVHAIRDVAETIREFEFRAKDGTDLPPTSAGAHISVSVPGVDWRSYSLINGNDERHRYVIAVNRDPKSRGGSAYMCETLAIGDTMTIRPAANHFKLVETAAMSVLIAGGIGITPIYSMIQRLEAKRRKWQLVFAARSRARAAFVDELEALEKASPAASNSISTTRMRAARSIWQRFSPRRPPMRSFIAAVRKSCSTHISPPPNAGRTSRSIWSILPV